MNFTIDIDDIDDFIAGIRKAIVEYKMSDDQIVKCICKAMLMNKEYEE